MLIRVVYKNGKHDYVNQPVLDRLIAENKIEKFLRREGWAVIGIDRIRGMGGSYFGPERRRSMERVVF